MLPLPDTTDVLIVGAGPTGLTLACGLAQRGVPFVLIDKGEGIPATSRAAVVHARTLELLETVGVSERLVAQGIKVRALTVRDRDKLLMTVWLDRLPTRYSYALTIPQNVTETTLLERLKELGGGVYRRCTATSLRQDENGATVSVRTEQGATAEVRARYVVGADGLHSTVREAAGIPFDGGRYDLSFVLADVRLAWPLPETDVGLFFSAEGLVAAVPLPGGIYRVIATMDDAPEHPDIADIQRLIDRRGPGGEIGVRELLWSSRFRIHHGLARTFHAGRVVLAGDAAHVHSPAGGQGMNIGIHDGLALAEALNEVIANGDAAALDGYSRARRTVARRVVVFTDRLTRIATLRSGWARGIRNLLVRLAGMIPAVRRGLAMNVAELRGH